MSESPPKHHLKGLAKHSAIYSAAPVIRQLISVGMTRLYTGWLGTAAFGIKENVDLWVIGLQQILGQNILGSMVRFYFDREDPEERERVVSSCTVTVTIVAWLICGMAFCFNEDLAHLALGEGGGVTTSELEQILKLVLVLVPVQLSTLAGFHYLMILKRSGLYTTIQTAKLLVEVGLNFWLIGALGMGVRGFLISMLIGEILTSVALTGWMLVTVKPRVDWRVLRPILIYAAPLIPVGLCQLLLHQVDRRLIIHYWGGAAGQEMAGIYGLGYKISYLVTAMMLAPFIQIFHPWIFGITDPQERARLLARVSSYAVLAIGAASLGVILFGRQAAMMLGKTPEFWEAYRIIPFVAGGYVFWALYHVAQMPLFIAKRTGRLFIINLAAVVVNVGLNAWMIPRHGYVGAAITTAVTFAFLAGAGMIASRSEVRVPFELGRIGSVLGCVVIGGALALWIDTLDAGSHLTAVTAISLKGGVLGVLLLAIWFGGVQRSERTRLRAWIKARRRAD
jgi:O-antigen/teichoic acid export membrane protein